MLTRDLIRARVEDGQVRPLLLKATPAVAALAAAVLDHWRAGVGRMRGELEEGAVAVLHQGRSLVVAKGLQKLVVDACRFEEPASGEALRERAFDAAAQALAAPAAEPEAHRARVAAALGCDPAGLADALYADLDEAAVLRAAPPWDEADLIARYNLALCQGLLLGAASLAVEVHDRDAGVRRRLLKALRWRRLLAEVAAPGGDAGALRLAVSGPAALVDQAARYGLNLALFLPALAGCARWRAEAEVRLGRAGEGGRLVLDQDLGLVGDSAFLAYVPPELKELGAALGERLAGWRIEDGAVLPLPGGELVAGDLRLLPPAGAPVDVELFHRWHAAPLARRLGQLAAGAAPRLLIGVDRALVKKDAALAAHPLLAAQGFLFSELPAPRTLAEAAQRLAAR